MCGAACCARGVFANPLVCVCYGTSYEFFFLMPFAADGKTRLCGTPGCELPDFHDGPCSCDAPSAGKRQRLPAKKSLPEFSHHPGAAQPYAKRQKPHDEVAAAAAAARAAARKARRQAADSSADAECDPRPAQQMRLPSGLARFYHVHNWGVPLPDGPVDVDGSRSDDEVDERWLLDECAGRMRARVADGELGAAEAEFMELWNAYLLAMRKSRGGALVSDRSMPQACRDFARGARPATTAAAALLRPAARLHGAFRAHLRVLWDHNLLHRDDVQDCLLLAGCSPDEQEQLQLCAQCARPQHEPHCALAQCARGAAAWALGNNGACDRAEFVEQAIRPGGVWEAPPARAASTHRGAAPVFEHPMA